MIQRRISFSSTEPKAFFKDGYGRGCYIEVEGSDLYISFEDSSDCIDGGIYYDEELIAEIGLMFRVFYELGVLTLEDLNEPPDDNKY